MWLWVYTKRMWYHFLPHPVFQNRKTTESWVEPESDLRLLLSSLVQSSGLGMRLPSKAPKINWVWIHTTCTSSVYSGCTIASHMSKATTKQTVTLFPFISPPLLSFMPCTICSGLPHNATHSASYKLFTGKYIHRLSTVGHIQPKMPNHSHNSVGHRKDRTLPHSKGM